MGMWRAPWHMEKSAGAPALFPLPPGAGIGVGLLASLVMWGTAVAQPAAKSGDEGRAQVRMQDIPPVARAGVRVQHVRDSVRLLDRVVIVEDSASYLEAIARWSPAAQYPVLIDDGTRGAREDIARFVRGFKPAKVVRWSLFAHAEERPKEWTAKRFEIEGAQARALGMPIPSGGTEQLIDASTKYLASAWKQMGPIGVVVSHEEDHAWPAALALAAGRAQPILWWKAPRGPEGVLSVGEGDELCKLVESWCESNKHPWRDIGDATDSVTLCLDMPVKMQLNEKDYVAVTDRVGRLGSSAKAESRWAFAGQISASPARSAYMAMCGLFLMPSSAWLFDGYPNSKPWNDYDMSAAAAAIKERPITIAIDDTPKTGERDWRVRCARAIDAGLIMVNTKGNADFFELEPGMGRPGDVPILNVPAMAYVVHSWSAQWPNRRDTVGGRFLEHGVYAYAGSVHEPYLQGFLPTPKAAQRLMAGVPFGAAVRFDTGPMWKIAVLGDPLATYGPDAYKRMDQDPPLPNAAAVGDGLVEVLKNGKFAEGMRTLALLGRDADIRKLATTLLDAKDAKLDSSAAAEAILPVFRAGGTRDVVRLYERLNSKDAADEDLRDALWLSAYTAVDSAADERSLEILRDNVRPGQIVRDAADLARIWKRKHGAQGMNAMLAEIAQRTQNPAEREAIRNAGK